MTFINTTYKLLDSIKKLSRIIKRNQNKTATNICSIKFNEIHLNQETPSIYTRIKV